MNTRNLAFAFVAALAISAGMLHLGSKLSFGSVALTPNDQREFRNSALQRLNGVRMERGLEELAHDHDVQRWLENSLLDFNYESGESALQALLDDLPNHVPSLSTASIRSLNARKITDLKSQISFWAEAFEPQTSVLATHLYPEKKGRIGAVLIAANRVPEFSLALLNEGETEFFNVCRHCDQPHIGRLSKVDLALSVGCPHCKRSYDLLASDMLGNYHRANDFLEGSSPPPEVGADAESRLEEMVEIWRKVTTHCRYAKDLRGLSGEKDSWQRPSETFTFRNGDCEDTSLLLADWLISRGFDARVAVGDTANIGGHAWTVVNLEGRQYLLETTSNDVPNSPPETATLSDHYRPHFLFDRSNIYFFSGSGRSVSEYYSSDFWTGLAYEPEAQPTPLADLPL